jgi:hypothetical protein
MITELSPSVLIWRSRACPAIVDPGASVGPVRRPAACPSRPPPTRLPPPAHPRPAVRLGAGAPGGGRLHHQGALRRPGRRAEPGGPPQAEAEALGRHRRGWHPVGGGAGAGQPPRRRAAGRDPGRHRCGWGAAAAATVHLDAGYDFQPCRQVLHERGMVGQIATRGKPAPVQASRRWPVERTHAWGNQYGKLRWCTERCQVVVAFWLALAGAAIVCGRLVRRGWTCYRSCPDV